MDQHGYAGGVSESPDPRVIECGHLLCHAAATEGLIIMDPWAKCIFVARRPVRKERRYVLCDYHYTMYCPRGGGWLSKENSTRLRVQCKEADRDIVFGSA